MRSETLTVPDKIVALRQPVASGVDARSAMARCVVFDTGVGHCASDDDTAISRLGTMRGAAFHAFLGAGWLLSAVIAVLALVHSPLIWLIAFASVAGNALGMLFAKGPEPLARRRWAIALIASLQPLLFLIALRLAGFDALTPLAVYVGLMALTSFCDRLAIYAAATATFLGILSINIIAPHWLFVGEDFWRSALFAAEHVIVTVVAVTIAEKLQTLITELEEAERSSAKHAKESHQQAGELDKALRRIETEREKRERQDIERNAARQARTDRIAQDFGQSINALAQSISQTTALLDRTTKTLSSIAHETCRGAAKVSEGAAAATHAARIVAGGVAELSTSISEIAADASEQSELAASATRRSVAGGEAMGALSTHSKTIGETTRAIVRIAERTNLLSLNAAIEASSAGPAGRGFTIVAQEVKALARQASEAATTIDTFLRGVCRGTREAEVSFEAIDSVIAALAQTAEAICSQVERQRRSADAIEDYARSAADDVSAMATRSKTLARTAASTEKLLGQLEGASDSILGNVRDLERCAAQFVADLKADSQI